MIDATKLPLEDYQVVNRAFLGGDATMHLAGHPSTDYNTKVLRHLQASAT